MTTNDNEVNEELPPGRYRPVNFFKPPFSFGTPLCIAQDTHLGGLYMILIELKSIKDLVK